MLTLGLVFGPVLCHALGPEYSRAHRMLESMVLTAGVDDVADRVGGGFDIKSYLFLLFQCSHHIHYSSSYAFHTASNDVNSDRWQLAVNLWVL